MPFRASGVVSTRFFRLYAIDLNSFETKKLWEVPNFDKKFLPGSNMVYNKEESCFYIITGNMGGVLLKISINEPGIIPVSEIQHFDSGADFSFSQLYHCPSFNNHLYCSLCEELIKTGNRLKYKYTHYLILQWYILRFCNKTKKSKIFLSFGI